MNIFTQSVFIEIQGPKVLELIGKSDESSCYQVHGFKSPEFFIIDYRKEVNKVLNEQLQQGDISKFAYFFSSQANAQLIKEISGNLLLKLYDTQVTVPDYMVWLVVGLQDEFPCYAYEFQEVQKSKDGNLAGISIFQMDYQDMVSFVDAVPMAPSLTPSVEPAVFVSQR